MWLFNSQYDCSKSREVYRQKLAWNNIPAWSLLISWLMLFIERYTFLFLHARTGNWKNIFIKSQPQTKHWPTYRSHSKWHKNSWQGSYTMFKAYNSIISCNRYGPKQLPIARCLRKDHSEVMKWLDSHLPATCSPTCTICGQHIGHDRNS
jgi:hypothetical protein